MRIMVIGGGGREHAIVWALGKSEKVSKIFCAPGNAGIAELAECVPIPVNRFDELIQFAWTTRWISSSSVRTIRLRTASWMRSRNATFRFTARARMRRRSRAARFS